MTTTRTPRTDRRARTTRRAVVTATVPALLLGTGLAAGLPATAAWAKDGDQIIRNTCGTIAQKLKLSPEDGGLEVEYELDQNRVGRTWRITVQRDGARVATRTRTTTGPSGSLEVRVVTSPGAIRVIARPAGGGAACTIDATG